MEQARKTGTKKRSEESEERDRFGGILDAYDDMRESFRSIFPPEFVEHISNAGRENLLAVRSLIDSALKKLDKEIKRTERSKSSS